MDILKIVEILQSYSESLISYKLDLQFAEAVTEAVSLLISQGEQIADLENKLATVNGGWVPVALGFLPEEYVSVLGYIPSDAPLPTVKEVYWSGSSWGAKNWIYGADEITHWMPLPDPPKED